MSMKAYFERLQQEHNVTCVEFVADQAKTDGLQSPISSKRRETVKQQRPSFHSDSERISSAPTRPSRVSSCESLVTLSQLEEAFVLLNLSIADRRAVTQFEAQKHSLKDMNFKPSSLEHMQASSSRCQSVLVSGSE